MKYDVGTKSCSMRQTCSLAQVEVPLSDKVREQPLSAKFAHVATLHTTSFKHGEHEALKIIGVLQKFVNFGRRWLHLLSAKA